MRVARAQRGKRGARGRGWRPRAHRRALAAWARLAHRRLKLGTAEPPVVIAVGGREIEAVDILGLVTVDLAVMVLVGLVERDLVRAVAGKRPFVAVAARR